MTRQFPSRCSSCGEQKVNPTILDTYSCNIKHYGHIYSVVVKDLPVLSCGSCGELYFLASSDEKISDALRNKLGFLSPAEVTNLRKSLKLSRYAFANKVGMRSNNVKRLEEGIIVQSRRTDKKIRELLQKE